MKPLFLANRLQIIFYFLILNTISVNYFQNARLEEKSDRMSFERLP